MKKNFYIIVPIVTLSISFLSNLIFGVNMFMPFMSNNYGFVSVLVYLGGFMAILMFGVLSLLNKKDIQIIGGAWILLVLFIIFQTIITNIYKDKGLFIAPNFVLVAGLICLSLSIIFPICIFVMDLLNKDLLSKKISNYIFFSILGITFLLLLIGYIMHGMDYSNKIGYFTDLGLINDENPRGQFFATFVAKSFVLTGFVAYFGYALINCSIRNKYFEKLFIPRTLESLSENELEESKKALSEMGLGHCETKLDPKLQKERDAFFKMMASDKKNEVKGANAKLENYVPKKHKAEIDSIPSDYKDNFVVIDKD